MVCGGINPGNPYLWLSLAGILFGGGARFLVNTRRRRKPVAGLVFISVAVLSLLASVYLSGFSFESLDFRLYWLGASLVLGYIGFFFWKAAGIPLLFILVLIISAVWSSFYGMQCAEPGNEICRLNIISRGEDFLRVQYETFDGITGLDRVDGLELYPELEIIKVPDFLFILNENGFYRFSGFTGAAGSDAGNSNSYGIVIRTIMRLPGSGIIKPQEPLRVAPSVEYSLFLNNEGEPGLIKSIE